MRMQIYPQDLLQEAVPSSRLFTDWVAGTLDAPFLLSDHADAGFELSLSLIQEPGSRKPAPWFASPSVDSWAQYMGEDLPCEGDRQSFRSNLDGLKNGSIDVVVTGQQPGFLGGPLYTMYKIATAVALAQRRSEAGMPTLPMFWSGDDDDDLAEALSPVAWDPGQGELVGWTGVNNRNKRRSMIGRLAGQAWTDEAAEYLARLSSRGNGASGSLASDLADIWNQARADGLSWSRLARRAVLRTFSGHGLMVVSGDDSDLHETARPLYEKMMRRTESLGNLASQRGRDLTAGPWHAQINDRSLARPLFKVEDDHRIPWDGTEGSMEASNLRPGVMFRSPVQDWLFNPAAVIVGPGELAYLRQLDSVYAELDIVRAPLVPRLFAWLAPPGFDPGLLAGLRNGDAGSSDLAERLADRAEGEARRILERILTGDLGMEDERAASLASGRTRRWRKGVAAMLAAEIEKVRRGRVPQEPAWVFPRGERQERKLAYGCAAAIWGDDLVTAAVEAARLHLEYGTRRDWREFIIEVPEPR